MLSGNVHEVFVTVKEIFLIDQEPVQIHERDLFLHDGLDSDFLHERIGVTHQGDEYIHEDQLDDVRWSKEDDPVQSLVRLPKVSGVELAEADQVNVDGCVDNAISWDLLVDVVVGFGGVYVLKQIFEAVISVFLKQYERIGKCEPEQEKHYEDRGAAEYNLAHQAIEPRKRLEQTHPFEQLEPEQEHEDSPRTVDLSEFELYQIVAVVMLSHVDGNNGVKNSAEHSEYFQQKSIFVRAGNNPARSSSYFCSEVNFASFVKQIDASEDNC